jgi:hypothetical protein
LAQYEHILEVKIKINTIQKNQNKSYNIKKRNTSTKPPTQQKVWIPHIKTTIKYLEFHVFKSSLNLYFYVIIHRLYIDNFLIKNSIISSFPYQPYCRQRNSFVTIFNPEKMNLKTTKLNSMRNSSIWLSTMHSQPPSHTIPHHLRGNKLNE